MNCERSNQVHRYHDGELPAAERVSLEAHLRDCGACRELLSDLVRLSAGLGRAALRRPSAQALRRMQHSWKAARDRGVIRLAGWLTAAAAALLMAVLLGKPVGGLGELPGQAALWETAAITPPAENDEDSGSDQLAMAQWMADDLATASRQ